MAGLVGFFYSIRAKSFIIATKLAPLLKTF